MLTLLHAVLFLALLVFLLWLISRSSFFEIEGGRREHLYAFFLLKVIAGTGLILIYTYYYTDPSKADIYRYFNDSVIISRLLFKEPLVWLKIMAGTGLTEEVTFNYLRQTMYYAHPSHDWVTDNTFIIRINVLLNYFSVCNIYINCLLLNFASFCGLVALFKTLTPYFKGKVRLLYIPLFLIPSVVFWSSGPLKEQLLFALIGFYVYALNNGIFKHRMFDFILAACMLLLMLVVKPPMAILLLACTFFLPVFQLSDTKRLLALFFAAGLFVAVAVSLDWHYKACDLLIDKRNEFVQLASQENAGSFFDNAIIDMGCGNLLRLIPSALTNALFRPFVWDKWNALQMVFAVENIFFLGLIAYLLLRYFKLPNTSDMRLLAAFCLLFAFANYLLIGLTVPIMGAIVHYRIIPAVFLLVGVLCFVDVARLTINEKPR